MEVQFHGANCLSITTKQVRLVIDDNLTELGAKTVTKADDVAVYTGQHGEPKAPTKLIIDGPGEYEIANVSVQGLAIRAHIDETEQKTATLYKITTDDINLVVTGHIYPELSDAELEVIGTVDLLFIPVGGSGYTLDAA